MSKKVVCIRHAEPDRRVPFDPPLSEEGRRQASMLSGHYPLVVLSPLRRTLDTYVHSEVSGARVVLSDLLREQRDNTSYNQFRNETMDSESTEDLFVRIEALKKWLREQPETEICLFTSAFLMCYFLDSCKVPRGLISYTQVMKLAL